MMDWFNYYAPVFMLIGSKPNPFDNETHTTFCGIIYILWRAHIVKGKCLPR